MIAIDGFHDAEEVFDDLFAQPELPKDVRLLLFFDLAITRVFEDVRYGGGEPQQDEFNALLTAIDEIKLLTFAPGKR